MGYGRPLSIARIQTKQAGISFLARTMMDMDPLCSPASGAHAMHPAAIANLRGGGSNRRRQFVQSLQIFFFFFFFFGNKCWIGGMIRYDFFPGIWM
ncbi:hypothetical protein SORBI_3002G212100 [Sorghum bicolor]|uniref:Uncharacterized protein n=1 Tax=Sorghum bicolor TaxID=4558 RepID=A0A1B6QCR0_SORBI|nr:hypothetical protein SORBI_3002G212100 [Sorghum bicolor]